MRHVFVVVGSEAQLRESPPEVLTGDAENQRRVTWYACANQDDPADLLDDANGIVVKLARSPLLAYRFYLLIHNTRLWSGKRPLILIRGRGFVSRLAAHAGTWGGGDVVMLCRNSEAPLGPTRYLLRPDGKLELRTD
mgnify:FL=1